MILLIVFAFLAGIVTVLSPCILPILPIILSSTIGGKNIGKSRPIGVVMGFILSFTFFTLFLSTIVSFSGIPADSLRLFSVIVIAVFGISFLIPQFQLLLEKLFSKLAGFAPVGEAKSGFWSGLLVGFSIGLLWTPCVGPILASVISLAITGTVTLNAFIITFAYALGTAIPMFAIMIGGQNLLRKVPWLLANTGNIQKAFGVVMIVTAFAIFMNFDRTFQTFILKTFPQYGVGLTKFEDTDFIRNQLQGLGGKDVNKEDMGKPMFDLLSPKGVKAPEIIPGGVWFNPPSPSASEGQVLKSLRGKVVIVDFWTYSCINCQRTLPYLKDWYKKYKDKGLVIIGVHSPEFEFEKSEKNVKQAIADFGLEYPIVQDNNFATWRAYNNSYWPAKYFVDKEGYIRYTHFGEGAYDESEKVIQELLKEAGAKDVTNEINNPKYQTYGQTPETYLGYLRIDRFASPERIAPDAVSTYTAPNVPQDYIAYDGKWTVTAEYANPQKGAKLYLNFSSKEVFLVMRTKGDPAKVKVFIDDKLQYFGEDNKNGIVTVDSDRLYKLINLPSAGRHILRLEFQDNKAELYAFTFG
jgi:cytochrome c biogenesis protein CcdA/thiol-disulfide isomerase/thioredoxin